MFGEIAEALGCDEREVEPFLRVSDLWESLCAESPGLKELSGSLLVAVNRDYVDLDHSLKDEDEVAFFPPVSGG